MTKTFIRNLQLFRLGISELEIDEKLLYKHLEENRTGLRLFKSDKNPHVLLYVNKKNIIVYEYYGDIEDGDNYSLLMYLYREPLTKYTLKINFKLLYQWWFMSVVNSEVYIKHAEFFYKQRKIELYTDFAESI